ncbi:alkene reductase [Mesorhizobium sp. B2-4-9]|uniref:alkene reductase n=1 Tax=Mesorhizobium sp. B2-4-9 TaxID=2589940 RepID=UPI0011271AD9|nr:alkene reductase [Mesorhizobium sp. B2-4-9]TPL21072.1 alkene reductase [Mesorhizobium sp. B2-4-9]
MTDLLFSSIKVGGLVLPHRIAMAPMTRARSTQPGDVPNRMMADYYAQRASASLIVTEATQISRQGQGYSFTPGAYSADQVAGWRLVTDAVHKAGGRIFLQLWHVGRMSHSSFHPDGKPVAPSALSPDAAVWLSDPATGVGGMVPCPVPRALETEEVPGIVEDYRRATANAMSAGFDGVEIHGANGYLIDEFLRRSSNHRTDRYGGSKQNRMRFLLEVAEAVSAEAGADRTGIRLSPFITQRNMKDDEIIPVTLDVARELGKAGLAYIHLSEADGPDVPDVPEEFRRDLKAAFSGAIIAAGYFTKERAEKTLASGLVDVIAFGRPFIGNPDLPRRLREGLALADHNRERLFGGGPDGYSDYPGWSAAA